MPTRSPQGAVESMLAFARTRIDRVDPVDLGAELARGALLVDIRPEGQRRDDGALDGAIVIDRNVLEWRLTPTSPWRIPELTDPAQRVVIACNEGYASSVVAADLKRLGLVRATDLAGGYQALLEIGSSLVAGEATADRSVWSPEWQVVSPPP